MKTLLLTLLFMWFSLLTSGQQHVFHHWQVEDGLPNNSINKIIQSADGYIWVGTNGGLSRFDGTKFTNFDIELTQITGSHRILGLFEDSKKRLWIGTNGGGLSYFEHGVFHAFDLGNEAANHGDVKQFYEDEKGNLYIGTTQYGLFIIKPSGKIVQLTRKDGLSDNNIISIFEDKHHRIWVVGIISIHLLNNEKLYPAPFDIKSKKIGQVWFADYFGSYDAIVGTVQYLGENFVRIFCYKNGEFSLIPFLYKNHTTPAGIRLGIDAKKDIYISSAWGLLKIDLVSGKISHNIFSDKPELSSVVPIDFIEDKEKNKWIATSTDGLLMIKDNPFVHINHAQKGSENSIAAVASDGSGKLWWSTANKLMSFDGGKQKEIYPRSQGNSGVVYAAKDTLYFTTKMADLYCLHHGQTTNLHIIPEVGYWIKSIIKHKDKLYVGTASGFGLYEHGKWRIPAYASILKDAHINRFYVDSKDRVWACAEKGIFYIKNDSLFSIDSIYKKRLVQNRCVLELGNGNYVFGTYGKGLIYFDGKNLKEINSLHGLTDNTVSDILKIGDNLWLAGNKGLTKVPLSEFYKFLQDANYYMHCTLFDKGDGLYASEFNGGYQSTSAPLGNNKYAFATINGIAIVDFNKIMVNEVPPKVVIEGIRTNDRVLDPTKNVSIHYDESRIEIAFAALSFTSVKNNQLRYMLEGYDKKWNTANTERIAVYTHLPPGNYTFKIIACNNDGIWNMEGQSLNITIIPPFYLTLWFKITTVIFITLILLFIIWLSINRIRKNENLKRTLLESQQKVRLQAMMETEETERKRIAEDLHDGIGPLLSTIKINLALFQKNQPNNELITDSAAHIDQVTTELRNITYNLIPASLGSFGLGTAVKEFIVKLQNKLPITFYFEEIGDANLSKSSQVIVFRTIQELINNSIKHSNCDEITVQLITDEITFTVLIEDNGIGFDLNKAFDKLQSRGLKNIYDRCNALGAKLNIDTQPGRGTTVIIEMKTNA
ncbi:MAG: two-component regulator propeller domain-containing protein [Bacteroidia bacterium]